ncbi:hypothetical protein FKM82_029149 [Ascaphus truei]
MDIFLLKNNGSKRKPIFDAGNHGHLDNLASLWLESINDMGSQGVSTPEVVTTSDVLAIDKIFPIVYFPFKAKPFFPLSI